MRIKLGAVAGLVVLATALPSSPAHAAAEREQHCAARVVDKKDTGELVLSQAVCRATRDQALTAVGAGPLSKVRFTTQAQFTIGTHYDGATFTGSSFSVVGSDCGGGWLNLSATWDNRVSSTVNGCPRVLHYDGDNLTGAVEGTYGGGGNLVGLNNRANSIQYST